MAFAYRRNSDASKALGVIQKGRGHTDMILELLSLSLLDRQNTTDLDTIHFDSALLDQARDMHTLLSEALAGSLLHAKQANEVREYGQFVFANDPEHADLYASDSYRAIGKADGIARRENLTAVAEPETGT